MTAALLVIAAVWLVTGWWSRGKSRRVARFWGAAALFALAAANALEIVRMPGPWWPLLAQPWSAGEWFAVLLWLAVLLLIFRARERKQICGLTILACGTAAFVFGGVTAASGQASHAGELCQGQARAIGPWLANLRALKPIADRQFTGVEAEMSLRSGYAGSSEVRPQHRDYNASSGSLRAGADSVQRMNGELLAEVRAIRVRPDCIAVKLEWRPFVQWLRYGAWLSLAGAILLLAAAILSTWRRAAAWERIAMRRADRRIRAVPVAYHGLAWQPLVIALAVGLVVLVWQLSQRTLHVPAAKSAIDGPAMITARQSLFGGPRLVDRWIVTADALARHGQFGDAAGMLQGATDKQPGNAEAWLAMGDALYGHAGGRLVAAAELAYHRADRAAAEQGKSASLTAEAMARSGRGGLANEWRAGRKQLEAP